MKWSYGCEDSRSCCRTKNAFKCKIQETTVPMPKGGGRMRIAFNRIGASAGVIAVALILIVHGGSCEEEGGRRVATIQYLQAYRLAYFPDGTTLGDQDISDYVYYCVESKLPRVRGDSISLVIDGEAGPIPLAINARGSFRLPFSNKLLAENPDIVSNQPKGSLSLECVVSEKCVVLPKSRAVAYRSLITPELLSRSIEAIIDGESVCRFPETVSLRLDRPVRGNVVIQRPDKAEEIPIHNGSGLVHIALSSGLFGENPLVVFPETVTRVYLVEDCGQAMARLCGRIAAF